MLRLLAVLASAVLAGCAGQVPIPENAPHSIQQYARAAHHWQLLATDVAAQLSAALARSPSLRDKPIFIYGPASATPFNRAFSNMLITALVRNGSQVVRTDLNAAEVRYETQVIVHNSPRFAYRPGTLSVLGAGLLVLRGIDYPTHAVLAAAGLVGVTDYALSKSAGLASHTELVVTTSVMDGEKYLSRQTDIYYLEDDDAELFLPCQSGRKGRLCRESRGNVRG